MGDTVPEEDVWGEGCYVCWEKLGREARYISHGGDKKERLFVGDKKDLGNDLCGGDSG